MPVAADAHLTWAAGLFEGEGHFTVRRKGPGYRAQFEMGLTTTDEDVAARFAAIAQCGNLRNKRMRNAQPHWKAQHNWTCGGAPALAFAERLLPHLGHRRQERHREILEIIANSQPIARECELCRETFTPKRFAYQRYCTTTCRDRAKYERRVTGAIPGTSPHRIR